MLELKSIKKNYPAGFGVVEALKGVDLQFRDSEFVSILGPSGCGKTTALNIIGGLDQYTSGDLIINGRSTKDFKDRDWDTYRNHSVGFVFQTYNLIPHQSVLQNVELALSLSGVSKSERKKRAKEALELVGLGDQLRKKPGEMSGGQMQRVAIARAIVNNPDIILADEPTGALDTETSIQVMDILKEISKDRLVIMVTHNPELAEKYSTRIIRMLDGVITSDSRPVLPEEQKTAVEKALLISDKKREKKPSMSLKTSFGLSLKNLFTKKGRTILTSFAGSIGIIGIALIYAVSQGMTTYINTVQEETLASYPLTLEATHVELGSLLEMFMGKAESEGSHGDDGVYQKSMMYEFINALNSIEEAQNDLKAFKKYVESERASQNPNSKLYNAVTGVQYTYDMNMLVYTKSVDGKIILSDAQTLIRDLMLEYFGMDMSAMMGMGGGSLGNSSMMTGMTSMQSSSKLWQEILKGDNGNAVNPVIEKQYDVVYGSWPNSYDEIILVVDENNELDDMTLYALGLVTKDEIDKVMKAAANKEQIEITNRKWTFEEICDMEFRTVLASECYRKDSITGNYYDLRKTDAGLSYLYDKGISLKVSGIVKPKADALSKTLKGTIGYTHKLTEYIAEKAASSSAVTEQLQNETTDIFTGLPFKSSSGTLGVSEKAEAFRSYIGALDQNGKADAYIKIQCIPDPAVVDAYVSQMLAQTTREMIEKELVPALAEQMGVSEDEVKEYLSAMDDERLFEMFEAGIRTQYEKQYAETVAKQFESVPAEQLAMLFDGAAASYTDDDCAKYYDAVLEFSESTLEANLRELGYVDLDMPSTINLYTSSFENKDVIEEGIAEYNNTVGDLEKITYTDYVGIMMGAITTIIDAITYVLIAFVAVSLVVSSIMIGVITLISVQERTKEIGILRAIGASKRNVSGMFNAETMIIGFSSGLLGVVVTYLLCLPINAILHALTGINNLSAYLPVPTAIILIVISMLLTLVSGIIPSRSAAKKDPVVALRTE